MIEVVTKLGIHLNLTIAEARDLHSLMAAIAEEDFEKFEDLAKLQYLFSSLANALDHYENL